MERFEQVVEEPDAGTRVDQFIAAKMGVSRGEVQRLLDAGAATLNGAVVKSSHRIRTGDLVAAAQTEPVESRLEAESIPLDVVYEDADLMVIDKPRGMVVHPGAGTEGGTLANAVLAHADDLSGIGGELRPGIVHRLDKDTSGLLVVAKNDAAHRSLQQQIQEKTAVRAYHAVLWGVPTFKMAEIDAPIGRHPIDRKKMAVITDAKHNARRAVTQLTVLEPLGAFSFVEARLQTGRTHQIRVHCSYIGHPVVGDGAYGGLRRVPSQGLRPSDRVEVETAIERLNGQALHAYLLAFTHPRTGEPMEFRAEMPNVMSDLLVLIRRIYSS